MSRVLEQIGAELMQAASRFERRKRRRRRLIGSASVLLATGGGVAVATGVDPLANAPWIKTTDSGTFVPSSSGEQRRSDVVIQTAGVRWRWIVYRDRSGHFCGTVVRPEARAEAVGCGSGFNVADNFLEHQAPVMYGIADVGNGRVLVHGTTDQSVKSVRIVTSRETTTASLGSKLVRIEVDVDPKGLTAEGKRRAATFPDSLVLRPYAAVVRPTDRKIHVEITTEAGTQTVPIAPNMIPHP